MKMNFINPSGPVTLQLLRTPNGVKAVFDGGQGAFDSDAFSSDRSLSDSVVAESPDTVTQPMESARPGLQTPGPNAQFLTLRKLASDLHDIIELEGARLGWTAAQIRAFQAPVERIRDAAQAVLERTTM